MGKKRQASSAASTPAKKLKLSPGHRDQAEAREVTNVYAGGRSDEQEDFPRGGRGVLSALEKRLIREKAKQEVLFNEGGDEEKVLGEGEGEGEGGDAGEPPRKKKSVGVASSSSSRLKKHVPVLSQKTVAPGLLVLGAVHEITDLEVMVSLPHNVTGVVAISNVSDPVTEKVEAEVEEGDGKSEEEEGSSSQSPSLSRLFHKGQLVVCYVMSVEGKEGRRRRGGRVELSVNPRLVNSHLTAHDITQGMVFSGWVRSVEDHGYIVDLGVAGKSGFLLRKNASEFIKTCNMGKPLVQGQVIRCKVLSAVDARSVPVSIDPSLVCGALVGGDTLVQLRALQPGMLVNAAVKETLSNGLLVSFLGGFEGSVSERHLPLWNSTLDSLPIKKKVKGRLLWVNVEGKSIGLTLQKTIVSGRSFTFSGTEFGDKFESAEIVHVYSDSSLLLDLGSEVMGYARLSLIYDGRQERLSREHRAGARHACRVVQFNLMDGVAILSLQPSVLSQRYMKYADISVGDVLEATVEKHGRFGMVVSIQGSICGLCPTIHISDVRLKNPQKRYKEGSKVKCRVLTVEAADRRVLVTCKKSLLKMEGKEMLSEYSQARPGEVFRGVIGHVHERGCTVFFFNNVTGYIPLSELSTSHVTPASPASLVWAGQLVECRVLECVPETKRLRLSLRLDRSAPLGISEEDALKPGMVVTAEVTGMASNGISLCYPATGEPAFLPTQHLSDYPAFCPILLSQHQSSLAAAVKEGHPYQLPGLLVVCGKLSWRPALLSCKPSLSKTTASASGWASDFSQIQLDQRLTGYIKKVMSYGCFVEFPHNLSALAPTKFLRDEFVSDPGQAFQEGQTVFAKVLEVDEEKRRFLVSLRQSDLRLSLLYPGEEGEVARSLGERLDQYLVEREQVMEAMGGGDGVALAKLFKPGKVISGKVTSVEEREVALVLGDGVAGVAFTHTAQGVSVEEGGEVRCCVLDVDVEEMRVAVSLNPKLVEGSGEAGKAERRRSKIKQAMLLPSSSLVGLVERRTPCYLLLSIPTLIGTQLAYGIMDTGQLGALPAPYKHIKLGQKVSTVLHSPASMMNGKQKGPPVVVVTSTQVSEERKGLRATSAPSFMEVKPGDIISVIVQTVKTTYLKVKYHLWQGRVHCCLATDKPRLGHTPFADISPGDVIKARVVRKREKQITGKVSKQGATLSVLELTTKESLLDSSVPIEAAALLRNKFSVGEEVLGFVEDVRERGVCVHLSPKTSGFIPQMMASNDPEVLWNLRRHFAEGEAVKCTIIDGRKKANQYIASFIGPIQAPSEGAIMNGLVHEVSPLSLTLSVPWGAGFGRVDITDLSDKYRENPLEKFKDHRDIVRCCVVGLSGDRLDLSLRPSRIHGDDVGKPPDPEITSLEDLPEGVVIRGYVKAVTDVGAFVRLGRGVDGRVQIKHLMDGYVKDYKSYLTVGQLVTAKVIRVNPVTKKVELSLRLSHTDPAAAKRERRRVDKERGLGGGKSASDGEVSSSEEESSESEGEGEQQEEEEEEEVVRPTLQLPGGGGFVWEDEGKGREEERKEEEEEEEEEGESSDGEQEDVEETTSKKSRRQKRAAKRAEEEHLYMTERALLEDSRAPETAEDYERLLLSHPNSSAVWVQYMAFLLHTAEVDKARSVGERALQAISFREEEEKLNVWVALMNLENLYGSQESLVRVFQSALQQNEPLEVFRRLVAIYQQSEKMDLAEQLYQTMTKRFASELQVWTQFGQLLMKRGKLEAARRLLQRCLKAMTLKQHHIEAISKFGQYEFKYGDMERGRTMFESLLTSYPRRTDLWSVYVDMLVKAGELDKAREVLERAIHLRLSARKMKLMFKRYLEFERQHGSPAGVEAVKDKARTYVESQMTQQELDH